MILTSRLLRRWRTVVILVLPAVAVHFSASLYALTRAPFYASILGHNFQVPVYFWCNSQRDISPYCATLDDLESPDHSVLIAERCHNKFADSTAGQNFWRWESLNGNDTNLGPTIPTQQCVLHENPEWAIFRMGSFETHGGYSWTGLGSWIHLNASYQRPGRMYAISAYLLGNTDDFGALIGFPPIHQHHFHIFGSARFQDMVIQTHYETQCCEREGGVRCLNRIAPSGFAYIIRERVGLWTEFNDVRQRDSEALSSWVLAAMKLIDREAPVTQMHEFIINFFPLDINAKNQGLLSNYLTSALSPSFGWTGGVFPSTLTVVHQATVHKHSGLAELLFFQGTPDAVFNDVSTKPRVIYYGQGLVSDALQNMKERQSYSSAAQLACASSHAAHVEWVSVSHITSPFERKGRCFVNPSIRPWVLVVFHRARWLNESNTVFAQHSVFRMYISHFDGNHTARVASDSMQTTTQMRTTLRYHTNFVLDPVGSEASWANINGRENLKLPLN